MGRTENKNFKYLLLKKDDMNFYKFYKNLREITEDLEGISESALISYFSHQRKLKDNDNIKRKSTFRLKDYKLIKLNEPFKFLKEDDELIKIVNKRKEENILNYYNNLNSNNFIMIC